MAERRGKTPDRWRDTRMPESRCPFCGHKLDAAGSPKGSTPSPGDMSVCISCASPLVFEEGLRLRAMTAPELAALDEETRETLERYQRAVRQLDRREMENG